jgi:hypothetical protein
MKSGDSPQGVLTALSEVTVAAAPVRSVKPRAVPLLAIALIAVLAVAVLIAVKPSVAQTAQTQGTERTAGSIKPFAQLPPEAQQGIQILTTCSAAFGLFAQRVAKDDTIAQHYEVSSVNLLKMAATTIGVQMAQQMANHSREAMLKQSDFDVPSGLTIAAATQSCNDIVRSTFVDFFK